VTPQQAVALAKPCHVAEECAQPAYRYSDGDGWVVLTVNSGFE